MKLSEAIRLGSMLGPQLYHGGTNNFGGRCAIKSAALAMGKVHCSTFEAEAIWLWLKTTRVKCPACRSTMSAGNILILHLNDWHRWPREQIADWVATIEPEEVHASETIREVQLGQGPLRTTPEVETFETITK